MTAEQLKARFVNCAQWSQEIDIIEPMYDAFCNLENVKSIREIISMLEVPENTVQAAE
jgi:hypothetical protein